MSQGSVRSVSTLQALEKVGEIDLELLMGHAGEFTMHRDRRRGDVVGVAAQVQRLGLAIERVQQR